MKSIIENFEKNRIGPDEPFKFHCTMCGKCRINREDILLTPRNMYNLAKELSMTPQEVMNTYCETYIGSDQGCAKPFSRAVEGNGSENAGREAE